MKVFHGRLHEAPSEQRTATFTGTVWADPIMPADNGVSVTSVFFSPNGRTHWHTHGQGQVLQVTAGKGWICLEGEAPQMIRQGDVVWIGPNERHWHGAASDTFMIHTATSLGRIDWQEPVADADYPANG